MNENLEAFKQSIDDFKPEAVEKHVDFTTKDTVIKEKAVLSITQIQSVRSSEKLELVGNKFAEKDVRT
jgi:hypothetical protein